MKYHIEHFETVGYVIVNDDGVTHFSTFPTAEKANKILESINRGLIRFVPRPAKVPFLITPLRRSL
jgi:hypothetical protein